MIRIVCLGIGYVCGLFQTSYIYGKLNGIDIREHGSGNAGTTNALRTLGLKAGLYTFLGDTLKTMIAILIINLLFKDNYSNMIKLLSMYAGAGAILGHNFPFYLKFKGGKGIAATAGIVLSFDPIMAILGIITFFSTFFATHYVSLGSLLVYIGLMIETIVLGQMGMFGMSQPLLLELYGLVFALAVLAFYKHRANIKRLLNHTENKTYLKKKKS